MQQLLDPLPKFASPAQVAQLLGISTRTLRRWTAAGRISCYRTSARGRVRFAREDVEQLVASMREPSPVSP